MADFSVGIVGLDSLGAALTRRLDEQGIGHTATDLNARLLQAHLAGGGSAPAGSPYDLAKVCDLILLTETSDETLREAVLGSVGLVHALRPGTIIVDMSDAAPQVGPALARALYAKGAIWIEATPVGSPAAGARRQTDAADGGSADTLERIATVLRAFAAKILRLGELGTGPLAKALASAFGALSIAIHTEMLIVAKNGRARSGRNSWRACRCLPRGSEPHRRLWARKCSADATSRTCRANACRMISAGFSMRRARPRLQHCSFLCCRPPPSPPATRRGRPAAPWMSRAGWPTMRVSNLAARRPTPDRTPIRGRRDGTCCGVAVSSAMVQSKEPGADPPS